MRREGLIVAALLLVAPCSSDAGGRVILESGSAPRGPLIRLVAPVPPPPAPPRPHHPSRRRLLPGFVLPADVVFVPVPASPDAPLDEEPIPVAEPAPRPVAEPKVLLPPGPPPPDPTGARTIVIQRGDQIEVQTLPAVGTP